jgi:2-polyprenyl-3-methyl-5-hydroxy-6-metoxy-1,4-benzoquinol methylase
MSPTYDQNEYMGKELELFKHAVTWKKYFSSFIASYILGNVLEVGAGIGETTKILCTGHETSWTCLEPDKELATIIKNSITSNYLPDNCTVLQSTIDDLTSENKFDTILYIDVIEHIEDDLNETIHAIDHLNTDGYLIILVPAYQSLYTPFDAAIGHYRRYNKKTLRKIIPNTIEEVVLKYLDSAGLLTSLANRVILNQSSPNLKQIKF